MFRFQLVPEVHIIGRLKDSQSSTGLVQKWDFDSGVQQFHIKVGQHKTEELLDLITSKKPAWAFGDPRAEGHAVITEPPSVAEK